MKRHISFFAFLLCVFAAVGPIGTAKANVSIVCAEEAELSDGYSNFKLTIPAAGGEGKFYWFLGDTPMTAKANPPSDPTGTYRVEWLTLPADDESGMNSKLSDCTSKIATGLTITAAQMTDDAKKSGWRDYRDDDDSPGPLIALKYIRQCTVSTAVSPAGAGTVTGGATVDAGGSVTLKATAKAGWKFSKWLKGDEMVGDKDSLEIEDIQADAIYTAMFIPLGYSVSKDEKNSKITVSSPGVYNEDLEISWAPEGEEGYDYLFSSAKVLAGTTTLMTYEDKVPVFFNMKDDCGTYNSSISVRVEYTKTAQNRDLKLEFNEGIETIGYKIGNAAEWTVVTEDTTVKVPVGTQWQAYAAAADGYVHTETSPGKPRVGIMGANGATFSPTASLDGFTLTVDPNGGFFKGSQEKYTFNFRLRAGLTNLNEIGTVTFTNGSSLIEFRDEKGEPVYDNQGHNVEGTYWTANYPSGTFRGTGNLTIKAIPGEPAPQFTITTSVYPEGAGIAEGAGRYNQGSNIVLKATANTGYSFWHWTKDDEEVSTATNYQLTVTANAEYVAVFTGKVHTVTCYAMNPATEIIPVTVTYGSPYGDLPNPTPPDGKELDGWYTLPGGTGDKIVAETKVSTDSDHMLFANWKDKSTFTVTYTDPSHVNPDVPSDVERGDEITDSVAREKTSAWPANRDNRYWIKGWNPTLPLTISKDETITAIWESYADVLDCPDLSEPGFRVDGNWKVYTQDHYPNVGESCLRLENVSEGDNVSTTVTGPGTLAFHWRSQAGAVLRVKRNGVEAGGVFTAKDDAWTEDSVEIGEGETTVIFTCIPQESPDVFRELDYIVWTSTAPVETYPVTYDKGNFGTGEGRTDTKTNGVDLVLAGVLFTRDNYTQDGWSKNKDGSTSDYALGAIYTENAAITLYPHWLEKGKYTVSYSAGTDATGSAASQTAHIDETVVLHGDGHFARTGYSQDGWATSDLGEKAFEFGATYNEDVSTTLYPCWTNNRYTVTFNPNGGSVTPEPQVVTYDEAYGELPKLDGLGDYKFGGWTLASGDEVTAETTVKTAADHELTAKWTKNLGPYSEALDCDKLKFELVTDGWFVCNETPHKGDSCLRSATSGAELTATITESGTLTFWWRGEAGDDMIQLVVTGNVKETLKIPQTASQEWTSKSIDITASAEVPVTFKFTCGSRFDGTCDIDDVTWTPEGGGEPTPGDPVEVTEVGVVDGVFSLTIPTDPGTDYGVWTNADLTVDSWGVMGEPKPGKGKPMEFKWTIFPGFPQLFFRAHKVEYKK